MLDIKYIRENKEEVKNNVKNRKINIDINELLKIDEKRRKLQKQVDDLRAKQNETNKQIVNSSGAEKKNLIAEMRCLSGELNTIELAYDEKEEAFYELLEQVPNTTHPKTPIGKDDSENKELEKIGGIPNFSFKPKDHLILGEKLDLLDFERAGKVCGSKFYFSKNELVLLEIALISFALNLLQKKGYTLITTPDVARKDMIKASGFNPRDDSDQIYNIKNTDLSLIATAEITIGGYHYNQVLEEKKLPLKYVGFSHCFRKEAGTYGKESKGLYRVHQFTKVEMYIICTPEDSEKMHEELLEIEKEIFKSLEIPFRVVDICTGDLGLPAYRKFDLEAWMPMKNDYGEITSTSNCTDFQARRLKIKYKNKENKKKFVHTLNGTAIAISRAIIAILENNQQEDGSIIIPKSLRPFMNNLEKIEAKK